MVICRDKLFTGDIEFIRFNEDGETYIITGFNFYPVKGLIITPNIRMTSFEDGSDSTTIFKMNFQFKF